METGLFALQADHLSAAGTTRQSSPPSRDVVYGLFRSDKGIKEGTATRSIAHKLAPAHITPVRSQDEEPATDASRHLAQYFLQLANLPTCPLDRLSRYEYALWRQVAQILFALEGLCRRKPQERRGRAPI
jgi:hypothetical protein